MRLYGWASTCPHHPLGSFWESGKDLKAHDWFVLPLSMDVHRKYHRRPKAWDAKYGTHADLLKAFWVSIGFEPGDFMFAGMAPKRADWLRRVLSKLVPVDAKIAS